MQSEQKHKIDFLLEQTDDTKGVESMDRSWTFSGPNDNEQRSPKRRLDSEDDEEVQSSPSEINWSFSSGCTDAIKKQRKDSFMSVSPPREEEKPYSFGGCDTKALYNTTSSNLFQAYVPQSSVSAPVVAKQDGISRSLSLPELFNKVPVQAPLKQSLSSPFPLPTPPTILRTPSDAIPIPKASSLPGSFIPQSPASAPANFPSRPPMTTANVINQMLHQPSVFSPNGTPIPPSLQNCTPNRSQEEIISWWLMTLRAQTYCYILNDARTDPDKRFKCVFSNNCEKRIKGKGNLRRHIEWHLRRIEEEWKSTHGTSIGSMATGAPPLPNELRPIAVADQSQMRHHPIMPMMPMATVPGFPLTRPL